MSQPLTSVIIPAFNCEQTLATAVRSALNQEPSPLEVIIVDDGSTDGTELVAQSFQGPVRFTGQPHAGPAAARNRGAGVAHGKYIAFLDADDYWLPGFITHCQEFLEAHTEAIAVSVGRQFIRADGKPRILERFQAGPGAPDGSPFLIENFFAFWGEHDHVCTGSCVIRRDIIELAGRQKEDLRTAEDLEYWAYLATFGKWGFIPRTLWVCDSERAAARSGWLKKYRTRRKLCPTVDEWQSRIFPRLQPDDMPGFIKARGRVAAILAHNLVLAGRFSKARKTVRDYGSEMPNSWFTRLMRVESKAGWFGWQLACLLVRSREMQKAFHLRICQMRRARVPAPPDPVSDHTPNLVRGSQPAPQSSGVSVIIPAYNSAHCLGRAISSALEQTTPPAEIIVIDDGSTDTTASVALGFGNRIRFLQQENRGQGAARNAGLAVARGEYVAFLDADDFWLPGFLAACARFLRTHPEAIAVSTGLYFRKPNGSHLIGPKFLNSVPRGPTQAWVLKNFFTFWGAHDHVRTGSNLIRRSVILQAGFQQAHLRISQDLEYWGYLATFGPWGFIPAVHWVCDSENMALVRGWMQKYSRRRSLCPTVEDWQARIVPRLQPEHWPGFTMMRGRVAASFAQNHILTGRFCVARAIVECYGAEMPATWFSGLVRRGCRFRGPGWLAACFLVRLREYQKIVALNIRRRPGPEPSVPSRVPELKLQAAVSE